MIQRRVCLPVELAVVVVVVVVVVVFVVVVIQLSEI